MWFLLFLRERGRNHRSQTQGASLLLFALAFAGVILGGFWLGVLFVLAAIVVLAASRRP